jgi:predicted DNA-binding protein (UPF0251 family)
MRRVGFEPGTTYFKPAGIPVKDLDESILTVDESEALRLKDFLGMDQAEAAEKMGVSQPTFHRVILSARKKVADAIVNGKAIKIEGGNIEFVPPRRGSMYCICPRCGEKQAKERGVPCFNIICTKCKSNMMRGD